MSNIDITLDKVQMRHYYEMYRKGKKSNINRILCLVLPWNTKMHILSPHFFIVRLSTIITNRKKICEICVARCALNQCREWVQASFHSSVSPPVITHRLCCQLLVWWHIHVWYISIKWYISWSMAWHENDMYKDKGVVSEDIVLMWFNAPALAGWMQRAAHHWHNTQYQGITGQ